jgi:hypothetical protein
MLTGRGADLIIIDDPLKLEEALSQTRQRAARKRLCACANTGEVPI